MDAADRESYLADNRKVIELARAAPGCLDFSMSADLIEPDRINVFERWESGEDVERFRGDGPEQEQAARIRDAEVLRYLISGVQAP